MKCVLDRSGLMEINKNKYLNKLINFIRINTIEKYKK